MLVVWPNGAQRLERASDLRAHAEEATCLRIPRALSSKSIAWLPPPAPGGLSAMSWRSAVAKGSVFQKPLHQEVEEHGSHACGMILTFVMVLAYTIHAVVVWATAPIIETYSAGDVRNFGIVDLTLNISCPTCVPSQSPVFTNSQTEEFRVWHGYSSSDYPHCASFGAPEDATVADQSVSTAALCYSSDDISEQSGIVVNLWNMSTGGKGNRANVIVTGPSLVVTTPLEFWHEKTLLLGMNVFRDQEGCTSAQECNLRRELYLGSMQYDGRVAGYPGAKLNIRLLRTANVYTRTPGQTLWDVFGAIGGAYGLILSLVSVLVHFFAQYESKCQRTRRDGGTASSPSGQVPIESTSAPVEDQGDGPDKQLPVQSTQSV